MKNILITGATDGIGLEAAKILATEGHVLLLHGRNSKKLEMVKETLLGINQNLDIKLYVADFSILQDVRNMAEEVLKDTASLDVIINNAGVFVVSDSDIITKDGLDIRFAVNIIAPYILTKKLLPILSSHSRVVNVSSAAQSPVSLEALLGKRNLSHGEAYAQSKLALIMWSIEEAKTYPDGPLVVSINPKSFLGSKMVKEAYGKQGFDLRIGGDILYRAALSEEFKNSNGMYFDNDYEVFAEPHPFALNEDNRKELIKILDTFL